MQKNRNKMPIITMEQPKAEIVSKYYLIFDEKGLCFCISLTKCDVTNLPPNAVAISDDEHTLYKSVWEKELQNITLVKDKIILVDKYTPEQIKDREAEAAKLKLTSEAKTLLRMTDRFETHPYSNMMTEAERIMFREWRLEILEVSIGVTSIMPETPEFIKKLLEL